MGSITLFGEIQSLIVLFERLIASESYRLSNKMFLAFYLIYCSMVKFLTIEQ